MRNQWVRGRHQRNIGRNHDIISNVNIRVIQLNTLDEYDERIPGLMRSILGKIGERVYFQTPVQV